MADQRNKPSWTGSGNLIRNIAGAGSVDDTRDITRDAEGDIDADDTPDAADDSTIDSIVTSYTGKRKKKPRYIDTHVRKTYYFKPDHHRRLVRMSKEHDTSISEILEDALTVFFAYIDAQKRG